MLVRKGSWVGCARILAGVLIVAASASLPGCARRGDQRPGPADPEPRRGGRLRLAQEAPGSLDPAAVQTVYESLPVNQIFDGLVGVDASLNVVPALASTWTISRDGCTYTFRLRPEVRFHDGTPLTSADVVYTFERLLAPGRERASIASSYLAVVSGAEEFSRGARRRLTGVQPVDDRTVRIELSRPYLSFLEVLAMDGLRIVPRAAVERQGEAAFARRPVGTGPFRVASWSDTALVLEANPEYFAGPPNLDEVEIGFLRADEFDGGVDRLYRGDLDVLEVPTGHLDRVVDEPALRLYRYQELSLSFLGLLTGSPPLDDVRVRRAVASAIDRQALAQRSPKTRRPATGILPPGMPGYSPRTDDQGFDRARSLRLLAEAGHPGGRGLPAVRLVTTVRSTAAEQVVAQIRHDLAVVGVDVVVQNVTWPQLSGMVEDHAAPAFLLAWIADLADPDAFLRTLFESGGSANYFDFHDERTWELLERGTRETNPVVRAGIYRQAEQRILDLAPLVPLYHSVGIVAMRREVRGLEPGPLGLASVNLERVWLATPESES